MLDMEEILSGLSKKPTKEDGDDLLRKEKNKKGDDGSRVYNSISYSDLLPKEGYHLGLDISKSSTGITLVSNGSYESWNYSLKDFSKEDLPEIKTRRYLKEELQRRFTGMHFTTILVEDAFEGDNPYVTRLLYSLNTVIDELILDGEITCETFKRINNQTWKSWLWGIEPSIGKGLADKYRINACMNNLKVHFEGEGFQDKYDSFGMLLGYFYKYLTDYENLDKIVKLRWNQIGVTSGNSYDDWGNIPERYFTRRILMVDLGRKRFTKELLKTEISKQQDFILVFDRSDSYLIDCELLNVPLGKFIFVWKKGK